MSREIKFRVWDKTTDTMFTGSDLIIDTGSKMVTIDDNPIDYENDVEAVLMQYIGFEDKNGKEIYEGDIIKEFNGIGKATRISEIVWSNSFFSGFHRKVLKDLLTDKKRQVGQKFWIEEREFKYFEVIGNIYENPELLEEKQ